MKLRDYEILKRSNYGTMKLKTIKQWGREGMKL